MPLFLFKQLFFKEIQVIKKFTLYTCTYHFQCSSFLCVELYFHPVLFFFCLRCPLTFLTMQVCLWWILSTFYVGKSLYLTFFWKDVLSGCKSLDWCDLGTCIAPKKKSVILILFLCMLSVFYLWWFYDFLFFSGIEQFDFDVTSYSFLHVSHTWDPLSFLDLWVYSFHQVLKNFGHYFFKYFSALLSFLSFRDSNYMSMSLWILF